MITLSGAINWFLTNKILKPIFGHFAEYINQTKTNAKCPFYLKMAVKQLCLLALLSFVAKSNAAVSLSVNGLAATLKNDIVELNFNAEATISTVNVLGTNLAASGVKTFYLDWNSGKRFNF